MEARYLTGSLCAAVRAVVVRSTSRRAGLRAAVLLAGVLLATWGPVAGRAATERPSAALPLSSFVQINRRNYDAIRSASIRLRYRDERTFNQDQVDDRIRRYDEDMARMLDWIENRSDLSESAKAGMIAREEVRFAALKSRVQAHQVTDVQREYRFDLESNRYRLEEGPTVREPLARDDLIPGEPFQPQVQTKVTADGAEMAYFPRIDQAVVRSVTPRRPKSLPACLGVVPPDDLAQGSEHVTTSIDEVDGCEVIVYRLEHPTSDAAVHLYIDPSIGYRYRFAEVLKGEVVRSHTIARDYQTIGGIAFPMYYEEVMFDDEGQIVRRQVMEVAEAAFNQVFDEDTFQIDLTPETWVTDMDCGVRYRAVESMDRLLESAETLVGRVVQREGVADEGQPAQGDVGVRTDVQNMQTTPRRANRDRGLAKTTPWVRTGGLIVTAVAVAVVALGLHALRRKGRACGVQPH